MNESLYVRVSYAALIAIFMFCGVLRSRNLWPQADKDINELYPARKMAIMTYFSVLLLVPCLLYPQSTDARLFARCFWIIWIPAVSSLSFKRFFLGDLKHRKLRLALVGGVPFTVILILFAFALRGGDTLFIYSERILLVAGALGVMLTLYLMNVTKWIWQLIFNKDNSEDNDKSPTLHFAEGMFWLPLAVMFVAWVTYIMDNPLANVILTTWITVSGLAILVIILQPQRMSSMSCEVVEAVEPAGRAYNLAPQLVDRIENQIREVMERDCLFLDSNLTKATLLSHLDTNSLYLHIVMKMRFGSFNCYVNTLRLNYSIQYRREHPEAKCEEVAMKCGFGSVRTYYRAKKLYGTQQ